MKRLDPKNDLVFKLLLTRRPELLRDMLESILGRPIRGFRVLNPDVLGEQPVDKEIILDIRVELDDGTRVDVEMQMRTSSTLPARLIYYAARDYSDQLRCGEGYERLAPTVGIAWVVEPIFPDHGHWHSVIELRDRRTHRLFSDHLSFHILQLSDLPPEATVNGPGARVHRWGRFFSATTDEEYQQLASEDPIMSIALETLDQLSADPVTRRLARDREDDVKLYRMSLAASRAAGKAELLLDQLETRFGRLSAAKRARIQAATNRDLDRWARRILSAKTLAGVFRP